MPYKRSKRTFRRSRPPVSKKTQKIRKLSGQRPVTAIERLASFSGSVGRVARTVSLMQGLINSEVKFLDTTLSSTVNGTGDNHGINQIAEGDDTNQRNGRLILSKSLQYHMVFSCTGTIMQAGYAFVMDKRPSDGIAGGWNDVYTTANPFGLTRKNTASDRFITLKRGTMSLDLSNTSRVIKGFISLKGLHVKYNGTAATDQEHSAIYLLIVTQSGAVDVKGNIRYEWYDN